VSLAFYIYTILLLVVSVIAAAVCVSAHLVSRRNVFLYAAGMFLCYMLDISFIFQSEFLSQNLAFDPSNYYAIEHPVLKIAVGGGFLQFLWLIVCDYLDERRPVFVFGPLVAFVLASFSITFLWPEGAWRQFAYYSMRQVFLFWIALYCLFRRLRASDDVERMRMDRFKKPFIAFCILALCILLEDVIVILVLDPVFVTTSDFPLYLSERNFSENVLILVFAWMAWNAAAKTLALRFEHPPQRDDKPVQRHIDDLLPAYCKRYGLSDREAEVLRLILAGKDNQNIASTLTLALGTVKAHVHNILKKTGQANREDLKRDFWKG
jgi:DNA-binding CsgD family transcriptional regulator